MDFSDGRRWFVIGIENTTASERDIEYAPYELIQSSIFFHLHGELERDGYSTNVTDIFEVSSSSKVIRKKQLE